MDGGASLIVARRAPFVVAVRLMFPSPYRLDETKREAFRHPRSAKVGPRGGRTLSLSTDFGSSGAGDQRASGFGGERVN